MSRRSLSLGCLRVSEVGLGCWTLGRQLSYPDSERLVHAALDAGVSFFDTADRYGSGTDADFRSGVHIQLGKGKSEEFLGAALGKRRHQVTISTKFGAGRGSGHRAINGTRYNEGGGRGPYVRQCLENSLRRLGTDYIDLYQMHEPDLQTPIQETLGVLSDLLNEGKIREIGCSNFDPPRLAEAVAVAKENGMRPFVSVQNHYSVIFRQPEDGLTDFCTAASMKLLPYFPLESGVLSGKYDGGAVPEDTRLGQLIAERRGEKAERFMNEDTLRIVGQLSSFAQQQGRSILELAISWLACQPVVGPIIPGASRVEQIFSNVAAAGWKLSKDELNQIDDICRPLSLSLS